MTTSPDSSREEVTSLLAAWRGGDESSLQRLMVLVHDQLHKQARRYLAQEREGHTLQPTALVNEAFLKLADADIEWKDRVHFFACAARTMRQILADHARAHGAKKRGGDALKVSFDEHLIGDDTTTTAIDLHTSLERLERQDPRKAQVVELTYFGGMKSKEVAQALDIGVATVGRELRMARAWLQREMDRVSRPEPADE